MDPSIILGGMKLLGGLFGGSKGRGGPSPSDNVQSLAKGAREAAEKYGFNPLTLLQAGSGAAGLGGSGAPPTASLDLLLDGAADIADVVSGDAERRRQADKLNIELQEIKLDQARSGVMVQSPPGAVRGGEFSPERFTKMTPAGNKAGPFGIGPGWLNPGREVDVMPVTNSPGTMVIENTVTGGPITVPGDSEPWGIDELLTAVVVGGPQVVHNWTKKLDPKLQPARDAMKRAADWLDPGDASQQPAPPEETKEERAARKAKEVQDHLDLLKRRFAN